LGKSDRQQSDDIKALFAPRILTTHSAAVGPKHKARFWVNGGSWVNSGDGTTSIDDGNWHHVVGVLRRHLREDLRGRGSGECGEPGIAHPEFFSANSLFLGGYASGEYWQGGFWTRNVSRRSPVPPTGSGACYMNQASNGVFAGSFQHLTAGFRRVGRSPTIRCRWPSRTYTRAETLTNFAGAGGAEQQTWAGPRSTTASFTAPASGGDLRFTDSAEISNLKFRDREVGQRRRVL